MASDKYAMGYSGIGYKTADVRAVPLAKTARSKPVEAIPEKASSAASAQPLVEAVVTRWANDVMTMGIDVKGLWLIDFDNGSGYYCWQYPEEGLQFFHTYEEGFRGRTRIH